MQLLCRAVRVIRDSKTSFVTLTNFLVCSLEDNTIFLWRKSDFRKDSEPLLVFTVKDCCSLFGVGDILCIGTTHGGNFIHQINVESEILEAGSSKRVICLESKKPPTRGLSVFGGRFVGVVDGRALDFYDTISGEKRLSLGHDDSITSCAFCATNQLVITTSEDCSFKVWDLNTRSLFFDSFHLCSSGVFSVDFDETGEFFCVGSLGILYIYRILKNCKVTLCAKVSIFEPPETKESVFSSSETHIVSSRKWNRNRGRIHCETDRFKPEPAMLLRTQFTNEGIICSSDRSCFIVDRKSFDVHVLADNFEVFGRNLNPFSIAINGSFVSVLDNEGICMFEVSKIESNIESGIVSHLILPGNLSKDSPLRFKLRKRERILGKSSKSVVKNHSVTFHKRIKSSGYGSTTEKRGTAKSSNRVPRKKRMKPHNQILRLHDAPVNKLEYSKDGLNLVTASVDKSLSTISFQSGVFKRGSNLQYNYSGSGCAPRSVNWSCMEHKIITMGPSSKRKLFISCSDEEAKLFAIGNNRPLLTWNGLHHSLHQKKSYGEKKSGFLRPLSQASFFWGDSFINLSCGPSLLMYNYVLDTVMDKESDLEKLSKRGSYKLIHNMDLPCSAILDFACCNNNRFRSPIVICSGSNKSIFAIDMNSNKLVHTVENAHSRAIHSVEFPFLESSDSPLINSFCSSSTDNFISLWDMRFE
eukprot:TRINITY_DN893_c0_g2_i4.p1 TRINITY_DN893_c0_g2~~TRINITY_DN893_c0_g2_i4.p1  ORF type:complete len:698 (+),score=54.27 TRINITY_DN893_c0_g2_i4:105-2198(+)